MTHRKVSGGPNVYPSSRKTTALGFTFPLKAPIKYCWVMLPPLGTGHLLLALRSAGSPCNAKASSFAFFEIRENILLPYISLQEIHRGSTACHITM